MRSGARIPDSPVLPGIPAPVESWWSVMRRTASAGHPTGLDQFLLIVRSALASDPALSPSTISVYCLVVDRFEAYCRQVGILDITEVDEGTAASFLHAPVASGERTRAPGSSTIRNRRSGLRALIRTARRLGYEIQDPTANLRDTTDHESRVPICTDDHVNRLRHAAPHSLFESILPTVLALAEAGATNDEISRLRATHVDGDLVHLPGGHRVHPRANQMTDWGATAVSSHLGRLGDSDTPLIENRSPRSATVSASSAFSVIRLHADLDRYRYRIVSVGAWRAQAIHRETGSIEQAAHFLGNPSLDSAARRIDHRWQVLS